jgi:hypothetical protein
LDPDEEQGRGRESGGDHPTDDEATDEALALEV